ncbi:hypothetical protein HNY73_007727 [Argiope bruennichi]|uniref:Uncharacterized protein n=1 Tax=Argiope bruennichi TaxID=94029 RepID=A0A8T0FET2_ARGBR|nr:hypothetical protein HNY73_007727 [Argiope bruennichi]
MGRTPGLLERGGAACPFASPTTGPRRSYGEAMDNRLNRKSPAISPNDKIQTCNRPPEKDHEIAAETTLPNKRNY